MTIREILDAVSTLGALGFTLIAVYALAKGWIVPAERLQDKDEIIAYERQQKEEAMEVAKGALASHDRLAAAVESRNQLDRERLAQK